MSQADESRAAPPELFTIPLKTSEGNAATLAGYAGQVLLIVNVASKCGFTPQYAGLQRLYERFGAQGFTVLGFPSNDFLFQEPAANPEIQKFCALNYGVTFPVLGKLHVLGPFAHPLYRLLCDKKENPEYGGWIKWNFTKFLVDRSGKVVGRFGPRTEPENRAMIAAIEQVLCQAAPE